MERGSSHAPKPWMPEPARQRGHGRGRGAFGRGEGGPGRAAGAIRSANAGMSSDKAREKRVHRKPKVSDGRNIRVGLVGPKP